ncbi:MAG: dockerin type I repeat-containing protein [Oscillospiraceae bacterium]|nr:dockerin type I repeat-containing protein [Oscillospiraceae bacterium]
MLKKLFKLALATSMIFNSLSCASLSVSAVKPDVAVSIDQVSVTMHQLESSNYEVPVFIRLKQTENLNSIEFGLETDENCCFEFITENTQAQAYGEMLNLEMSCVSSPDRMNYAWVTWAQNEPYFYDETSNILLAIVKIPETAQPDDIYYINYLTQSPLNQEKNHVWYNYGTKTHYTTDGTVNFTNGYIQVLEDEEALQGDATLDGKIDIADVVYTTRVVLGKDSFTSLQIKTCDINQNGIVDAMDSLSIMECVVGLLELN